MMASAGVLANLIVLANLARLNSTASGSLRVWGGGIFCSAPATYRNLVVSGNRALGQGRATGTTVSVAGGGCYQPLTSTWDNVALTRNRASASGVGSLVRSQGGGFYLNDTAHLIQVNLTANMAVVSRTGVTTTAIASGKATDRLAV